MKIVVSILFIIFLVVPAFAQDYICKANKLWPKEKSFSASISIEVNGQQASATINSLSLSDNWPLPSDCQNPLNYIGITISGSQEGNEIKLGPEEEIGCSFILYLVVDDSDPTLLSPRKSYKVFGEKPYLAMCNKI